MAPVSAFRCIIITLPLLAAVGAVAQQGAPSASVSQTRIELSQAIKAQREAEARAARLEVEAKQASTRAEQTTRQAAAVAARVQQAEAAITVGEARLALIQNQRMILAAQLAERQQPVVRLTAALQMLSRRPIALSLLRPGSLRDTVYVRAMLETLLPEVNRRTAALREELARSRALQFAALEQRHALQDGRNTLDVRRRGLAALAARQAVAARGASSAADREAERAIALGEQARDLGDLVQTLGDVGTLRDRLAALPGPIQRPDRPEQTLLPSEQVIPIATPSGGLERYMLPTFGQIVTGFGEVGAGGLSATGLTLSARPNAQVVSPAEGRVAYAGPYRDYGRIVIIEHVGGFATLITGLARSDVRVGEQLAAGSPVGIAGSGKPTIGLELRRGGKPVNPVDYLHGG